MATDPRRLGFLLAVARSGGVLAAADALHLTPSAVSQQIARLEAEEGVQVLDRGPRGATLTPAGWVLADVAERIETELVEGRKQLASLTHEVSGTVVVGAFQTAIRAVLMPVLAATAETLPGVGVVIQEAQGGEPLRGLRAGDLDVVVLDRDAGADVVTPRGVRDVPLLDEPWRLVMSTGHGDPTSLHDLAGATWLGVTPGTSAERAVERVASSVGFSLRTEHRYDDYDVGLAMVAAGLGVTLVPALALQGDVPDGVRVVPLAGLGTRRLVARHRVTRHEPRAVVSAVVEQMVIVAAGLELG